MTQPLRLVASTPETPDEATLRQAGRAVARTEQDYRRQPRLAWDSVHDVVGPILPWQWWVVAAQTGNGKSTVLQNLLDDFLAQGQQVYMLPLEQEPEDMMLIQAALELDLKVSHVRANRWHKLPQGSKQRVQMAIEARAMRQAVTGTDAGCVYYAEDRAVDCGRLRRTWDQAAEWGATLVMIDHIHHLAHADHKELALVARSLTDLCKEYQLPALVAAQLNRGPERDPIRPLLPPILADIQGSAHIEQNAHVIFGVYRPLGPVSREDIQSARQGMKNPYDLAKPNTVGLKLMKNRIDGEYTGRIFELHYHHGRITCPQTEDRKLYEQRHDL